MAITNYPLSWPEGWKRTTHNRSDAQFNKKVDTGSGWKRKTALTVTEGLDRVLTQLEMMGVDRQDVIISTNVRTRLDGLPRSGEPEPRDPGAAVYWKRGNDQTRCMAIDRYTRVADNLAAIGSTLEAMRAIERHGGAEILNRTFKGFAALPEKASEPWRDVLSLSGPVTFDEVESQFKKLARVAHPDFGGKREDFERLVQARDAARNEIHALPETAS